MKSVVSVFLLLACMESHAQNAMWKAGTATVVITPRDTIWMAGFAMRTKPSDGKLHDLYAKALALEDSLGRRALLITSDLIGFPKVMSDRIRTRLQLELGLERPRIILSSSHTHSGPVLCGSLIDIYPLTESRSMLIKEYSEELEDKIIDLARTALGSMKPARLYSGMGVVRFQVNRRNNTEASLATQTELRGPNEYSVPVFRLNDEAGKLLSVIFGYSCHPTVLSIYQFSGDYPGFAQIELEKLHPGVTAMFFQGTGADQNALPRKTVSLAQQYGRELAYATERVIEDVMKELKPSLEAAYSETDLPFSKPPDSDSLLKLANELTGWQKRWAERQRELFEANGSLPASYPYPMQLWKLGSQPLFIMGGEVTIQYSIELKRRYGQDAFVMGYSNDVMSYIPSEVILREGGYEGRQAKMAFGLPADWAPGIEERILTELDRLASQLNINKVNPK